MEIFFWLKNVHKSIYGVGGRFTEKFGLEYESMLEEEGLTQMYIDNYLTEIIWVAIKIGCALPTRV